MNAVPPPGAAEALKDRVYRARLCARDSPIRGGNPLVALPLTLLGYLLMAGAGWQLARPSGPPAKAAPEPAIVDLEEPGEGEAPRPAAPVPPPGGGGPPPGALVAAAAPLQPVPASVDSVPETPPANLPAQDLSGVAFQTSAAPGPGGTGTGSGPGAGGTGAGTGPPAAGAGTPPAMVHYDDQPVKEKYRPPDPPYPPMARRAKIQGTVTVEITVGMDGVPISAHATAGPMALRQAAEAYASNWRFEPVRRNGIPVIGVWPLTVIYRLQ